MVAIVTRGMVETGSMEGVVEEEVVEQEVPGTGTTTILNISVNNETFVR